MLLEGPVLEAPGRSLFGLSGVLSVGSSRCLHSHAESLRVRGRGQARGWGWQGEELGGSELGGAGWRPGLAVREGGALGQGGRRRKVGLGTPPQDHPTPPPPRRNA